MELYQVKPSPTENKSTFPEFLQASMAGGAIGAVAILNPLQVLPTTTATFEGANQLEIVSAFKSKLFT